MRPLNLPFHVSRPLAQWLTAVLSFGGAAIPLTQAAPSPEQLAFFEAKIRPVLADKCYGCHSTDAKHLKGGLFLDSREGWIKGGETGSALTPGNPDKSMGITAIRYTDQDMLMPPKKSGGQLSATILADFESWVKDGAPWPEEKKEQKKIAKFDLLDRKEKHWCWKPPVEVTPPALQNEAWPKSSVDRFVLAQLEAKQLKPAPAADRSTLLRRVTFDLIGLPPTPEEVRSFLADSSPKALETVVERLLASPHFGERWARHWMDLVRYAEGRGHEFDPAIANAWQYRDYLIRALNSDIPYQQFLKEHVAGDLLPPRLNPITGANESILGTGFWFLGEEVHSPVDIRQDEADRMDNRLDVLSKSFLGITVTCARCHDHKFDAISQKDYTALTGFLLSSSNRQVRFETMERERQIAAELEQNRRLAQPSLLKAIAAAEQSGITHSKAMLLAARECFLAAPKIEKQAAEPAPDAVAAYATEHHLDPKALSGWIAELKDARTNQQHPLHLFASSSLTPGSNDPSQLTGGIHAALERLTAGPTQLDSEDLQILADYTKPKVTPWLQDGFAFGLQPARAGEITLGASPENPVTEVFTQNAAHRQALWKGIVTKGEPESGTLKDYPRSGQTLRTPELTLTNGQIWYLVRGAGRAYAVVDSHIMIQGPLHGKLLTKWKGSPNWEWVAHNLTDYKGHRVHFELLPDGQSDLEIAMVVESPKKPLFTPKQIPSLLASEATESVAALAEAIQDVLGKTANQMALNQLSDHPTLTPWADWMARNLDLFCPPDQAERTTLATAAAPWIEKQTAILKRFKPESHTALAMFDGTGVDEFLLRRGSARSPMAAVPRRFLEALAGPEPMKIERGSGRLELAELMADSKNPLTSRVIVNRIWHHLFGRGIVPTVDNFGVLGQLPTHPALLDHLALRFASEQKWSIKTLIRDLVLTSTYQMGSSPLDTAAETADPQNLLLHRMNLKRLEGEAIRDSILAVSGRLDPSLEGPSTPVFVTPFMEGRGKPGSGPLDGAGRRSVYISIKRNFLSPMMLAFDMPIPFQGIGKRNVSNVPAQSLVLMNDPFVVAQATLWAKSLSPSDNPSERIRAMYLRAFAREPLPSETADALQFLNEQTTAQGTIDSQVWSDLCHVLFNTKEFIHLN